MSGAFGGSRETFKNSLKFINIIVVLKEVKDQNQYMPNHVNCSRHCTNRETHVGMIKLFTKLVTVASGEIFSLNKKKIFAIYVYKSKHYFIVANEILMQTTYFDNAKM